MQTRCTTTIIASGMSTTPQFSRDLFPFAVFLATAARSGLEEGVFPTTFRLVDAISRLMEIFPELLEDEFFNDIAGFLKNSLNQAYLMSEKEYELFLDDLLQRFAKEVCKRNGVKEPD